LVEGGDGAAFFGGWAVVLGAAVVLGDVREVETLFGIETDEDVRKEDGAAVAPNMRVDAGSSSLSTEDSSTSGSLPTAPAISGSSSSSSSSLDLDFVLELELWHKI
jgi:hypothetical protein